MIKQLTLFCTFAIFMAAFLGFSVPAFAGKVCLPTDTSPKCTRGGGGGGDDHGDPPAQYLVELTAGGFYFGPKLVTRNNRGNSYNSADGLGLYMEMGVGPDWINEDAWLDVFKTCPSAFGTHIVTSVNVSNIWSIDKCCGKVTVAFRNLHPAEPPYSDVEMDLFLQGAYKGDFPEVSVPNDCGAEIIIPLDKFTFYVHAHGNQDCKISSQSFGDDENDHANDSELRMYYWPSSCAD